MAEAASRINETSHSRLKILLVILYIAAAILIGRASVEQNDPPFPLEAYSAGHAGMPYQARYLMVPVLRWASQSPLMARASETLNKSSRGPQQLLLQAVNSICLILAGWVAVKLRRRFVPPPVFLWLAPLLLLWVVAITFAVRYDQRVVLPYDFVALLLFNIGLLACLDSRIWLFLLILLVGTYNRETTVALIPIWLACNWTVSAAKKYGVAVAAVVVWTAVKLHLKALVEGAPAGLQFNWNWNLAAVLLPHHWAQLLSVGGFLVLPMWLRRDLIADPRLRLVWLGCVPFLLADLVFGVWNETRIFGELSLLIACTAALQFEQLIRTTDLRLPGPSSSSRRR
jgi:hypothetical protein